MSEITVLFRRSVTVSKCSRCGREFRLIDNMGTWQCLQDVPGRTDIYVRADHVESPSTIYFSTPQDDFYLTPQQLVEMESYRALIPDESLTDKIPTTEFARERMVFRDAKRAVRFDKSAQDAVLRDPMRTGLGYRLLANYTIGLTGFIAKV